MLLGRIIAVSRDQAIGQQLASALYDLGVVVDVQPMLDELDAGAVPDLCVIHVDASLTDVVIPSCPVIIVAPLSKLAAVVEFLQVSEQIATVMVAEELDSRQLSATASRILADDLFGLEKVMAPGTQIHSCVVGDYHEKLQCMALLSEFVEQIGMPRGRRGPIEQCIDEMLMNALYDAPVDADGNHIFAGVPTRTRITLRTEQNVVVQYASDGNQLAVAVRDSFGTLERATVLRHLDKGLHSKDQVDRKAGGAGLGLYLMANASKAVHFNVLPRISTEAVCTFELAAHKKDLEAFGFFVQNDAAGLVAAGPASALPGTPAPGAPRRSVRRTVVLGLFAVMAAMVLTFGMLVLQRTFQAPKKGQVTFVTIPKGAAIQIAGRTIGIASDGTLLVPNLQVGRAYPVVARLDGYAAKHAEVKPSGGETKVTLELEALPKVELDSQPPGAMVEIDGKPMGTTPFTTTSFAAGATVSVVFKQPGYQAASATLQVPAAGELKRLVQPLEASDDYVRVRFVSMPPGALIVETGKPSPVDRTYTPAVVFLPADQVQSYTLIMPNHEPLVLEPFTPTRGSEVPNKGGDLTRKLDPP